MCAAPDWQDLSGLAGDGAGGAFVSWADARGHGYYDLYAQHLGATGSPAWTPDGIVVSGAARGRYGGSIAADAAGGAIAGWTDNRAGNARYVFAQRIQSNGAVQWVAAGVTSVLASLVSARFEAGRARLAWRVSATGPVRIERATQAVNWAAIAERIPDGDGMVSFEDSAVEAGGRYGYRLIVRDAGGEAAVGEVWLGTTGALALALESPSPNPVQAEFTLAFTLPDASPARLELFDIRGRRLATHDVGAMGPGRHLLRLGSVGAGPGVYIARLVQRGMTRETRIVRVD